MASIVVADHAGACFGVERALSLVEGVLSAGGTPVHTMGPLIHNPQVVASLEGRGVDAVGEGDIASLPAGDRVVLRSHGVVPQVTEEALAAGLEVVDATCPYVKKVHRAAQRLAAEGYEVVVVGQAGHPEVEGILGHAPGAHVVGSAADARALPAAKRVGVVVQTTTEKGLLDEVVSELLARFGEVRVHNTICEATRERQEAAARLADAVDVMVVIGGKNSANTTRLAEICSARVPTCHVEAAGELDAAFFDGVDTVGVTAGASTPASQIEEVVGAIHALAGDRS
ncbi:4-hydroxy-3-methylbut-2-enyl diphosphate reductase [Atopobiaceae bacterium 24-176]